MAQAFKKFGICYFLQLCLHRGLRKWVMSEQVLRRFLTFLRLSDEGLYFLLFGAYLLR